MAKDQTLAFIVYPIVYPMKLCIEGWKKPWYTDTYKFMSQRRNYMLSCVEIRAEQGREALRLFLLFHQEDVE